MGAVTVKPLIWEENANGMWIGLPPVRLGELAFWVFRTSQGFIRHTKAGRETYPSLEAAQAAAQADYEPVILACLTGGCVMSALPDTEALAKLVEPAVRHAIYALKAADAQMAENGVKLYGTQYASVRAAIRDASAHMETLAARAIADAARIAELEAALLTARIEALNEARDLCIKVRQTECTTDDEAVGALECALALGDLIKRAE